MLIGVDAGEPRLIERWVRDGSLPHLAELIDDGAYGRLASSADWLVGSTWPTFFTGMTPADHGIYHYLQWDPARMETVRPVSGGIPPFWRPLAAHGPRALVFDVPFSPTPEPFNGVELCGWGTHDHLGPPSSYPDSLAAEVMERFGPSPLSREVHHASGIARLLRVRDELIRTTDWVADVALHLAERESWDLCLVCFSATHRGGHKLWSETGASSGARASRRREFADALRQVYVSIDRAIGRLVAAARGADVLVFSAHGMGPNTCHTPLLGELLRRVLGEAGGTSTNLRAHRILSALRRAVPIEARSEIGVRLPNGWQDRLTAFWDTGGLDWSRTHAFCPAADLQGYIRFNVRGREAFGVVEPGAACDALAEQIEIGLRSFVDGQTGEPIVRNVARPAQLYPEGVRRESLPDLIVQWTERPVADRAEVRSAEFGSVHWPTPGRNPDGRSGNHRSEGFLVAAGRSYGAGDRISGHVMDLVPTVYAHFGLRPPPDLQGRPLVPERPSGDRRRASDA